LVDTPAYDFFKVPPDIELCIAHQNASKIGFISHSLTEDICGCCGLNVDKIPIPFCTPSNEYLIMGCGIPLYFNFMKHVIALLTVHPHQ
jgi:hypothetical protein